jgi:NADP-dependent 3-hydroxy acid dehydrogenase YdfG
MNQKNAVITGASSGIGAETIRALVKAGFRVFIGARRMDRLNCQTEKRCVWNGWVNPFV